MISAEALAALGGLERGARYNLSHRTARELIDKGLAQPDWGHLGLTEAGRIYLRRGKFNIAIASDDFYSDLSVHTMQIPPDAAIDRTPKGFWKNPHAVARASGAVTDPMASPQHVHADARADDPHEEPSLVVTLPPEAPAEPLPIAESRMQEMLRAAGVASGKTGVWVEDKWVEAFVRALDGDA